MKRKAEHCDSHKDCKKLFTASDGESIINGYVACDVGIIMNMQNRLEDSLLFIAIGGLPIEANVTGPGVAS